MNNSDDADNQAVAANNDVNSDTKAYEQNAAIAAQKTAEDIKKLEDAESVKADRERLKEKAGID